MLRGIISDMIDDGPVIYLRNFFFQQDGAPPHYAHAVRYKVLNTEYGDYWIGCGDIVSWTPRSSDFMPFSVGEIKTPIASNN